MATGSYCAVNQNYPASWLVLVTSDVVRAANMFPHQHLFQLRDRDHSICFIRIPMHKVMAIVYHPSVLTMYVPSGPNMVISIW